MKYGILAYGSLIDNPGEELKKIIESKIDNVETPFNVEFARKSSNARCGAPTLVPYKDGKKVAGKILVIKDGVFEKDVKDILYRREAYKIGSGNEFKNEILGLENAYDNNTISKCFIIELKEFYGIDKVFTTSYSANIENLSVKELTDLAIKSFENDECRKGKKDGIIYLYNAKSFGIKTKLSDEYEGKILEKMGKKSLEEIIFH